MSQGSSRKPGLAGSGFVSYFIYEGELTRMERTNHRMWILCIFLLVSLIGSNLYWILR